MESINVGMVAFVVAAAAVSAGIAWFGSRAATAEKLQREALMALGSGGIVQANGVILPPAKMSKRAPGFWRAD